MSFFKIIRNAHVYAPDSLGVKDVLLAGEKVAFIGQKLSFSDLKAKEIDAKGKLLTPGFIDRHVHTIGGGGQQGFASLVPEVTMSELAACGTTTVIGLLGTDGFVKDLSTLYAKTQALCQDGLSSWMLTSFYGLPERTLTGSVAEDLIYIDKVIGCKLAMSDDRSAHPTKLEILRLVNQVRLGGFTSGKGGFLHIHLGNLPTGIQPLLEIAREFPTLVRHLSPTHMIRTEQLFEEALTLAAMGGNVDFSTGGTRFQAPHLCVMEALRRGADLCRISYSSDGHGGVRRVDPATGEVTYRPAPLDLNYREMVALVRECGLPLADALRLVTLNPAQHMGLSSKGRIAVGADADFCFMDSQLRLVDVMARGQMVMTDGQMTKKGRYER